MQRQWSPYSDCCDHISQLRDRGIGQGAFDITLGDGNGRGKQGCECANGGDNDHGSRKRFTRNPSS